MNLEATQTVIGSEGPELSREACLILIYGGAELGKRFALTEDLTIGREASNAICVDMSYVSRQHARVFRQNDGWFVEDLNSRNGTQVNGITLSEPAPLKNGDQLSTGGAIFKFVAGGNIEALFHEEIYRLTVFDGLTKVHNKRYLLDFLEREIARSRRFNSLLSVAMLDIDHFKAINDTHGHQAGDYVLAKVAGVIAALVGREQLLARYGGEEFAIVLPELERSAVRAFCENVRQRVAGETYTFAERAITVTISIGAATLANSMDRDAVIAAADQQLYEAKRTGRNRVML